MSKAAKNKLALFLLIPVLIFYTGYFLNYQQGYKPSGFIQYDNIGYVAFAKQYLDHPGTHIGYNNPFGDSGEHPRVYFQTQTIALAALLRTGIDPGLALCLFSIVFCFLAIRTAISLFAELYPDVQHRNRLLLLFIWGGGIFSLLCFFLRPLMSTPLDFWSSISYLDPEDGWWGLNFGRPLLFGTESYYHFLFFACLLQVVRKKWMAAALIAVILSFSHPFTGIHLLLVLLAWIGAEKLFFRNSSIPWWTAGVTALITIVHIYYYLFYLPQFPEHKSVSEQYSVNWNYRSYRSIPAFIPAYILVFLLFLLSFRVRPFRSFMQQPANRLLACLAIVSFLLCNHDWFIKPMQPIHFVRGYEWAAYFLLGVPTLEYLFSLPVKRKLLKGIIAGVITLLLLSDNLLWLTKYVSTARNNETTISDDQQMLLTLFSKHSDNNTLIIGKDPFLMPYCAIYTRAYPWISHPYTTPHYGRKQEAYSRYVSDGIPDSSWIGRDCIVLLDRTDSLERARALSPVIKGDVLLDSGRYKVMRGRFQ